MSEHTFQVEETKRDGFIVWDAINEATGERVPLNVPFRAGEYRELEASLGLPSAAPLVFASALGDTFDAETQTWTFERGEHRITVKDRQRTLARIGAASR